MKMTMDDETIDDMIEKAGYIEGLRPQWAESMQVVQGVINLHNQNLLSSKGYTREAHDEVSEINKHWARILQG